MGFTLRDGISFCQAGDRIIFLDILADRYFCLSRESERSFMKMLGGGDSRGFNDDHITRLVKRGLLVDSPNTHVPLPCASVPLREASVLDQRLPPSRLSGTTSALRRLAGARIRLKISGLARTLSWLALRKGRLARTAIASDDQLARIMADFVGATRFASPLDNCLAHSLAVASHMIENGMRPEIVLGVQLGPFSAHCWVQHGNRYVNDRVDMVRTFTPILVV